MFNKKLLGLLIAGGLIFTACGQQPAPSGGGGGGSGEGEKVVHQNPLVKEVGESQTLRKFSSKFDKMVDDFSGATLVGTLTNGQRNEGLLRVLVDSENDDFPSTPGKAILKLGSPVFGTAKPEAFGFKVRKVGNGTLSTNDLVLGLRGVNEDANVYPINLSDALDEDGEALPELTNEWQDIVVDLNNSIEDDNAVYPGTESKISETDLLAFHLYAKAGVDVSQMIEIDQVYYLKGTDKVVISEFDGDLLTDTKIDAWWAESTGFIVRKGVNINGGSYELTIPEGGDAYNYVAVEMNGDSSAFTINDAAVTVGAVNGAYFPFAMQFTKSGNKLKFASTKDLNISKVFLTNMEEEKVDSYPVIDIEHKLVFDDFNRTQATFTDDWVAASAADYDPDPISVALSYNNADKASVHNGYLDVQAAPAGDYVNVKEGNAAAVKSGYQYVVIVADGDLTGLRFTCKAGTKVMYSHDWLAAPGLKSIPQDLESYPYKTGNFVHYIIDLTLMDDDIGDDDFLDFYFEKEIKIDSIYFANVAHKEVRYAGDAALNANADLSGYAYGGYVYAGGAKQIEFTFEGEGNLSSFRFGDGNGAEWWFNQGAVKGANGRPISADLAFTESQPLTIVVDLEQTGITVDGFHFHTGGGATGSLTSGTYTRILFEQFRRTDTIALGAGNTQGYSYLGAYGQKANGAAIIEITAVSDVENATLASLRLEGAVTVWGGDLVLEDGSHLDPAAKVSTDAEHPTVIRIDLAASFGTNAQYKADNFLHFHFGGLDTTVNATITFAAKAYVPFTAEYEIGMYNVA